MFTKLGIVAVLGCLSLSAFANDTKGINGLKRFDCEIKTASGEIEAASPLAKTILASSKSQAVSLYLINLGEGVNMNTVPVTFTYKFSDGIGIMVKTDEIREISCN